MIGTQPSLMGELFSTEVRYSGMALGHEVASVFAGGLAPMLAGAARALPRSVARRADDDGHGFHHGHRTGVHA